jgi:hypothetical protein
MGADHRPDLAGPAAAAHWLHPRASAGRPREISPARQRSPASRRTAMISHALTMGLNDPIDDDHLRRSSRSLPAARPHARRACEFRALRILDPGVNDLDSNPRAPRRGVGRKERRQASARRCTFARTQRVDRDRLRRAAADRRCLSASRRMAAAPQLPVPRHSPQARGACKTASRPVVPLHKAILQISILK